MSKIGERWMLQTKVGGKWVNFFKTGRTFKHKYTAEKKELEQYEFQRLVNRSFDLRVIAVKVDKCRYCGAAKTTRQEQE